MGDVVPLRVWRFLCLRCGTRMTFNRTKGVDPPQVGCVCGQTLEPLPGDHSDGEA